MGQPDIAILILAAGQSSRMRGTDKLLEPVDGHPLIRRQALEALATGMPVWIALPPDQPLRRAMVRDLPLQVIEVAGAASGLSFSIAAGQAAVPAHMSLILWLADLPEIATSDLEALARAASRQPDAIIRATTATGKPGHPVLFPPAARPKLATLTGDSGARDLLKKLAPITLFIPLPANRALTDLDTPEDWAAWRAATHG